MNLIIAKFPCSNYHHMYSDQFRLNYQDTIRVGWVDQGAVIWSKSNKVTHKVIRCGPAPSLVITLYTKTPSTEKLPVRKLRTFLWRNFEPHLEFTDMLSDRQHTLHMLHTYLIKHDK